MVGGGDRGRGVLVGVEGLEESGGVTGVFKVGVSGVQGGDGFERDGVEFEARMDVGRFLASIHGW